ncbi:MAG TPA: tripartite tricarboxylate transporter substrate binding protein [Actinomycetota bacterium]|nr:tripartite tricarboxylate transporter substrate binding protein [Actinomycetota bacterium]
MIAAGLLIAAAGVTHFSAAHAQEYPAKPVRVLLGFPVCQATDILARIVSTKLSAQSGQQFYVDNRPGAAGIIATELAAKSEPNGYTLLATSSGPLTVNPSLYSKLPYDVQRDFVMVSGLGVVPYAVVVHPVAPFKSIKQLVAYAKANPGKLNYGSGGSGVTNHLVTELFKAQAGIDMRHVPYKGGPAALTDLVGGQIDVMFETIIATLSLIQSGKLRAIAVSSATRSSALPDMPTISESGYPGFSGVPWVAMAAPAKTPRQIVTRLNADINKILTAPDTRQSFQNQGSEPMVMTPEQLSDFVKAETAKWARAVKLSGAKVD